MEKSRIACFMLEDTGEMTPFVESISSPIYRRTDTGERVHTGHYERGELPPAPVGAMWFDRHPTARRLYVRTPGGDWCIDGPSRSGGGWSRSGEPPKITVQPSINIVEPHGEHLRPYHAVLNDGVLIEV